MYPKNLKTHVTQVSQIVLLTMFSFRSFALQQSMPALLEIKAAEM